MRSRRKASPGIKVRAEKRDKLQVIKKAAKQKRNLIFFLCSCSTALAVLRMRPLWWSGL